jgi:hypothetical protein
MSGTTPANPPSFSDPQVRDGSPHSSANPNAAPPNGEPQRRTSFGFLRRVSDVQPLSPHQCADSTQKSSADARSTSRSASGSKMSKKQKALAQEEVLRQQREAAMLPRQPPRLPSHSALPQIESFGGDRPDSVAIVSNKAGNYSHNFSRPSTDHAKMTMQPQPNLAVAPPIPGTSPSAYMDFDPYPRTESMTHRGRYSYASSQISTVNSPRRVRRRKDPTPFKYVVRGLLSLLH